MPLAAITGHANVVALLRHAAAAGRVPQSLLIAGPEGVGKRTLAIALAQAVNCPSRREGDGCGVCSTCQRIARGQHSDVITVGLEGDPSIKVEKIRDRVLHVIGYRPFEAERRVYIIDPAEEMGPNAQDALLKTLEEPPPAAILILISAYPDTLHATVQSRCRRIRLAALPDEHVARVLVERCGVERAKAAALATVSGGSVSHALAMAEIEGQLAEDRQSALDLITAAAARRGNVPARLKAAAVLTQHAKSRRAREAVSTRLAVVASIMRDLGLMAAGGPMPMANSDFEQELRGLSSSFDLPRLSAGFAAVARAQADLERSASPKIVADWIALAL